MNKLIKLSLILTPSIILIGCGSGGSDNNNEKQTIESALKISNAVYASPRSIEYSHKSRQVFTKKTKRIYNKITKITNNFEKETYPCDVSGNYEMEMINENSFYVTYNSCIAYNKDTQTNDFNNGTVSMSFDNETNTTKIKMEYYSSIEDYDNATEGTYYKDIFMSEHIEGKNITEFEIDGTIEYYNVNDLSVYETMTYSNLLMKENNATKAWFYKGGFYDKVGCFTQNHVYETDENDWLVENSKNSDYWSSGTLYVDSTRYVYSGDMVTVTKGDSKGTFKQQELIDELNKEKSSTDCDI